MADDPNAAESGTDDSLKGIKADHPDVPVRPFKVAPTTGSVFNVLALDITAVACLKLHDVLFAFDSSFLSIDAASFLAGLPPLRDQHKSAKGEFPPLSLFGHADPVGTDEYNKQLSGRRVKAVYAALTNDVPTWKSLLNSPLPGDEWRPKGAIAAMADATGLDNSTPEDDLITAYLNKMFPTPLQKTDFLGKGASAKGIADYQGCGEFNPLLLLSADENTNLPTAKRNSENQPNRRVVIYLFRPGRKIDVNQWPCPAADGPGSACAKRFFADATKRRTPDQSARREFKTTHDTFACRFYDRIAHLSPCESPVPLDVLLKLVTVDDHFAPSTENLDFTYNIKNLSGRTIKLRILADNYDGKTCFERDLTAAEKADKTGGPLNWDGKCTVGKRKDRFATPLMGPYKVQLFADDTLKDELPFKILYHSLELAFGVHTEDGKDPDEADKTKFVQAKLDALGYDAGPVDGTDDAVLQNAVRRFQRANYKVGTQTLLPVTGNVDDDTLAAIKAAAAREIFEAGKTPLTADAKFYVYDNFMNDPTADFVTTATPEFNSLDRKTYAEDKMERPFIALEAAVKLLNKANAGADAPDAVGDVPVAWEMDDAAEDASVVTHAPAQAYTKNAREIGTSATVAGAARIDSDGDNALDTVEGYRKSTAAAYVQSMFPNDAGSILLPYKIDRYDTEDRDSKTFNRAIVKAWDDDTKTPRAKGHAGVYFRFSKKSGDDGKVRVSLSFKGLPNQKQLEDDHKTTAANLIKETGRWTIWRRTRISAYCTQIAAPPRTSGLPNFSDIRDRWTEAFLEVENNGEPLQTLTYSTIVTQAVYNATITGMPASHRPPNATNAANLNYSATCVYGGPVITQAAGETAINFVRRAGQAMLAWSTNPINAILRVIYDQARLTSAEGFVIYDFRIHDAISGQDPQPGGGFAPTTNPAAQNFIQSTSGYVRCAGAVTMNVDNPFNVNCYLAHECGHGRFLYHHITQDGVHPGVSDNPTMHDADQSRCVMSYGIGADTPDQWRYFFCGKCLLRLRGWKITGLPLKYT